MSEPAPFTEEDREELDALSDDPDAVPNLNDADLIGRAAAYIERLEAALREIAAHPENDYCDGACAEQMVASARAALTRDHGGPR